MLVLTRRPNEKIIFPGTNTTVQVLAVKPGAVRLGIEAPPEVAVLREEVWARAGTREPAAGRHRGGAAGPTLGQLNHLLRDWLDVAAVGLALHHRQTPAGAAGAALDPFDAEIAALRQHMQRMGRQPLPKSRVLLVEDDRPEREALAGLLDRAGLRVATAGDGGEALGYLGAQAPPDVLLLSMGLPPPCDGTALVRQIRGDPACAGIKIFGVSSHGPERFALARGRRGVDHWFNTSDNSAGLLHDLDQELAGVV